MRRDRPDRPEKPLALPALILTALCGMAGGPGEAGAYEADTLAGLAQQAALASRLHLRLVNRFGLSLGLFDPLRLDLSRLPEDKARTLRMRLRALDPAGGYGPAEEPAPGATGKAGPGLRIAERQTALSWLMAGSVLESIPASRIRHHFLDPATGGGLHRPSGQSAAGASLQAVNSGISSFRDLMTGAAFDGTGLSVLHWLDDPGNELGLRTFLRASDEAVSGETQADRDDALAQALMSAGAILSLLAQMGDPAFVRNDFEVALLSQAGRYERFVAARYGRAGVPAPAEAPEKPGTPKTPDAEPPPATEAMEQQRLRDLFLNESGSGLAQRTAGRFYSPGSLPSRLPPGTTLNTGETPDTPAGPLPAGRAGYVASADVKHLLFFWHGAQAGLGPALGMTPARDGRLHYGLDERCHADYAALLLPETGRYVRRALELLFRGDLSLTLAGETLRVNAGETALGTGTLSLFAEGADGRRRRLLSQRTAPAAAGAEVATLTLPVEAHGKKRVVVLFTGADAAGEPLVASRPVDLPAAE